MPRLRRSLALLLLVLTLAPAISWAGPSRDEAVKDTFLLKLWSFVKTLWEENGSSLDPNGEPRPNEGSDLDPDGSTADTGSDLDPSG